MNYSSVEPMAKKDAYKPSDTVDFFVAFSGREIVRNSISITGNLRVQSSNANISDGQSVKYDGKIGVHNFFSQWTTELQTMGQIENFPYYPRYCRMAVDATLDENDLYASQYVSELRVPNNEQTTALLRGFGRRAGTGAAVNDDPDFWMVPKICLNRTNRNIRWSDTGFIKVSINLSRVQEALYGLNVDVNTTIELKNLRLNYSSLPESNNNLGPLELNSVAVSNQSISSSDASVDFKAAVSARSISMSFLRASEEQQYGFNNQETELPPNLQYVLLQFNDTPTTILTHELKNLEEINVNYLMSMRDTGHSEVCMSKLSRGKCFGVGLDWVNYVDLSNQKVSMQLRSGIVNNDPYLVYAYFHSKIIL
jgi:hypothetical protein